MKAIMILVFYASGSLTGVQVRTERIEFQSLAACEAESKRINGGWNYKPSVTILCIQQPG